jgi:hypothetical protein
MRPPCIQFFVGTAAAAIVPFALASAGKVAELPPNGAEWFTNVPVQTQDGGRCGSMTT